MPKPHDADVLIVGAGPVGLTLANDLARRSVSFRIIDPLPEATSHSKAHGVQSRTLEALDLLGLGGPLHERAQKEGPVEFRSGDKVVSRIDPRIFRHEPYPYSVAIWQQNVERVLEQALVATGHAVDRRKALVSFDTDADGVTAKVEDGDGALEELRAAWLVGCDGAHSVVRKQLGLEMRGVTLPGRTLTGEFEIAHLDLPRNGNYVWRNKDGSHCAILYGEFNEKWHVFVGTPAVGDEDPERERMQQLFREVTGNHRAELTNPSGLGAMVINFRMPDHFVVGRTILAGDAAHVHSGAGAQGMNTGIQDALNLGWKLGLERAGVASDGLVGTYEDERLAEARALLKRTQGYHKLQAPTTPFRRAVSKVVMGVSERLPRVRRMMAVQMSMLHLHYRTGPLTAQDVEGPRGCLEAGEFVPYAACRVDGRDARLRDVVRDPRATLLLVLGDSPSVGTLAAFDAIVRLVDPLAPHLAVHVVAGNSVDSATFGSTTVGQLLDHRREIRDAFGAGRPEIVYIRPDGYVGLRSADLGADALASYLERIYTPLRA